MSEQEEMRPQIGPMPVPTVWGIDHTPDGLFVVLVANTHQGQQVHFLHAETVEGFLDGMLKQKLECDRIKRETPSQHIEVPPQIMLGPDGKPMRVVQPMVDMHPTEDIGLTAPEALASDSAADNEPGPELKLLDGGSDED